MDVTLRWYAEIVDNMQIGLYVYHLEEIDDDRTLRLLLTNPEATRLTGLPMEEVLNKRLDEIFPGLREKGIPQLFAEVVRSGKPSEVEDFTYRDSRVLESGWAFKAFPLPNQCVGVAFEDVAERKRTQTALQESRRTLATLMGNLPGMAYRCRNDRDWTMEFVSQGCVDLTGYPPSDIIDNRKVSYGQLIHAGDQARVWNEVQAAVRERQPFRLSYRIATAGGEEKWVWEQGRGIFSPEGELLALEGFITDVTERKRAEDELRRSEERFRSLSDATFEGVAISEEGRILDVNSSFTRMFGYEDSELIGRFTVDLATPEHREVVLQKIRTGDEDPYEATLVRKDGTEFVTEIQGKAMPQGDRIVRVTAIRDITERKRLKEQLYLAQKLEAVGRLAGGVAHDFNNILTAIMGYTDLLLEELPEASPLRPDLEETRKAADRAAALTRQLLAFSRKQILTPQVLDLTLLVAELEKLLRRLLGEDIDLVTTLAPELGAVRADPGQLEQVIVNLAVNARDAMPDGGKLTIEARNAELDESYTDLHVPVVPGRYVLLAVSDSGTGMTPEVQAHLFEPFFTTKERGKGTGLGLATVYGIVKQSGGYVWVYSEPGHGTTFKVYLPAVDAPVEPARARPAAKPARGSETVLVVEDEEAVRTLARRVLEAHGYTVLDAARGEEATMVVRQHAGPLHLVITDVVLPGASGRQVADALVALRPELKVVYMSGYTDDAIVHRGVLEPGTAFLHKPFTPAGLTRKVRDVLDGTA